MQQVREIFDEFEIVALEVPAGGLDVDVPERLGEALEGCEACLLGPGQFFREVFEAADDLRVITLTGSGVDHIDLNAATDAGVVVANSPGGPAPSVAEHTFGMTFALLRDVIENSQGVADGRWDEVRSPVTELRGRTMGVVGLGTIGLDVARVAANSFGVRVVGYDPYLSDDRSHPVFPRHDRETVENARVELLNERSALFERSDIVSVHTPLNEGTEEFIGEEELAALGNGYFVNTSRGGVVDEAALYDALVDGNLSGAALDVFDCEPPSPEDPLLDAPNVVFSPHVAGVSDRTQRRGLEIAAESIRAVLSGERPETVVNQAVYDP